jgi:outer membrane protein TolC
VGAPEEGCIAIALQRRPEVMARRWELAALGDDLALARWAALDGAEAGVDSERDPDWSVGPELSLPIPLFDWGQARRRKAMADLLAARHELTRSQRKIVEEVRRAYTALDAAQTMLAQVQDELIPLQELRREQAEAAYRNGFADITTVLLAEQDAQDVRLRQIDLQRQVSTARIRLMQAVGGAALVAELESIPTESATTQPRQ